MKANCEKFCNVSNCFGCEKFEKEYDRWLEQVARATCLLCGSTLSKEATLQSKAVCERCLAEEINYPF